MKKVSIVVIALVFNSFLFSCTSDTVEETDSLYDLQDVQATEGDDADVRGEREE